MNNLENKYLLRSQQILVSLIVWPLNLYSVLTPKGGGKLPQLWPTSLARYAIPPKFPANTGMFRDGSHILCQHDFQI